jgi:hypothetical protein
LGGAGLGFSSGLGLGLQWSQTQHFSGLGLQCSQTQHFFSGLQSSGFGLQGVHGLVGLQGVHGLGGGGIGHTSAMTISFTTFPAMHQTFLQSFSASNFPRTTTTFFSFLSSNSTFSMQNSSASNEKQKTIDRCI